MAFDDLTLSEVNVSNPTLTWAQQFGYDGFGNLLSQTVTAGSAPSMSLSVNTSTNRVTNSGVTYDAAGNLTSKGTASYTYDELNQLVSTGLMSYGYNGDNKRVVAYYGQSYPQFTMNLYGPSGQRLPSFTYQNNASNGSGGWGTPLTSNAVNYLYLGSKPLNYSDDPVGSNASAAQYYPYGQVQSGSTPNETQAFGSYIRDESSLLYANQRHLYQNCGRFLTPDPSSANVNLMNSISWNRYAYVNGDPINMFDPWGLCTINYFVMDTGPTPNGNAVANMAQSIGWPGYSTNTSSGNVNSMGTATGDELNNAYNSYNYNQSNAFWFGVLSACYSGSSFGGCAASNLENFLTLLTLSGLSAHGNIIGNPNMRIPLPPSVFLPSYPAGFPPRPTGPKCPKGEIPIYYDPVGNEVQCEARPAPPSVARDPGPKKGDDQIPGLGDRYGNAY